MSKLYIKNIDGTYSPYNSIAISNLDIVQETGSSLTSAMSQKAVTDELTKKQDTINDLADIRSNAAKGATALQNETDPIYSADKPNLALKTEIPDISNLATKEEVAAKQDTIPDLVSIRDGASKGATALQAESDPVYLADKPKLALKTEIPDISGKVDKVSGKGLSANDYTDEDKAKLDGLQNYDDSSIVSLINNKSDKGHTHTVSQITDFPSIPSKVSQLTNDSGFISSIPSEYVTDTELNAKGYLTAHQDISGKANVTDLTAHTGNKDIHVTTSDKSKWNAKQDVINDLATIRSGASKGATALQSYTETDPIYIADKPNIALKSELSGKQDTITDLDSIRSNAAKGATALQSYTETDPIYTADKPSIALKSEIPDVSGKADKTLIVTETEGSTSYTIVPNKLTKLGTLASSVTFSLNSASEEAGVANIYDFIFTTPANAPSIT